MLGKEFTIGAHKVVGDPSVILLMLPKGTLAELPIWRGTSQPRSPLAPSANATRPHKADQPAATAVQHNRPQYLALLPLKESGPDPGLDWIASGVPETINVKFSCVPGLEGVELSELRRAAQCQELPPSCDASPELASAFGRRMGLDRVIIGSCGRDQSQLTFAVQVVDIPTGAVVRAESLKVEEANIFSVMSQIIDVAIESCNSTVRLAKERPRSPPSVPTLASVRTQRRSGGFTISAPRMSRLSNPWPKEVPLPTSTSAYGTIPALSAWILNTLLPTTVAAWPSTSKGRTRPLCATSLNPSDSSPTSRPIHKPRLRLRSFWRAPEGGARSQQRYRSPA